MGLPMDIRSHMLTKPTTCQSCPLYKSGTGFVPDAIREHAEYTICGEAPGKNELIEGTPFVGDAGFVLKQWLIRAVPLMQLASERNKISYSNVLHCVGYRTRIWMADGSWKQIQQVVVGESIKCVVGNEITVRPVTAVTRSPNRKRWYLVDVDGAHRRNQHGNKGVFTTPDHEWITPHGRVRTDALRVGSPIYLPQSGSDDFLKGCLLGDGHVRDEGIFVVLHTNKDWAYAKGIHLGITPRYARKTGGYGISDTWTLHCTVPRTYRKLFYNADHSRIWRHPENAAQAAIWFGDDGSHHKNGSNIWNLSIAVHRYLPAWTDAISKWAATFGTYRINGSIYFNKDASYKFGEWVAPWLHPSMEYKLPPNMRGRYNGWLSNVSPLVGTVLSANTVNPKPEISKHSEMCLVVEDARNFFTRCGLVSNCLPPMTQGRPYPRGIEKAQAEACCSQYQQLGDAPTVILAGETPQRYFFGAELDAEDASDRKLGRDVKGVTGRIGRVIERDGRRWVFCVHPAYVLRQPSLVQHGQQALAIATGSDTIVEVDYVGWEQALEVLCHENTAQEPSESTVRSAISA